MVDNIIADPAVLIGRIGRLDGGAGNVIAHRKKHDKKACDTAYYRVGSDLHGRESTKNK
jgi:hypothetical protein